MKGVNCSWRMERHPMKSQPQAAIQNSLQESNCQSRLGSTPPPDLSIYFGWWENAFLSFSEEGHCQGQHRIWKTPSFRTILRVTGGPFFSIVKKILTKTFSLFFPIFYQVRFLRYCFWKHFRLALNSDKHKPGLQDLCATRWWPENPVTFGVILEDKGFILGSHSHFRHSRMDFWHTSYSALPLHVLAPSYTGSGIKAGTWTSKIRGVSAPVTWL